MNEDEFQHLFQGATARYRVPPEPPLDRMWERIEARAFPPGVVPLHRPRRWIQPLAYAAVLVVGVGVGFLVGRIERAPAAASGSVAQRPADEPGTDINPVSTPFVGIANGYLEQATALLIAVVGELRSSGVVPEGTMFRARDLLSTTRLLLDTSPPDHSLHTLLEDLELVLAQVVRLPESPTAPDAALIHQTLDQREVLPRLTVLLADARVAP